jgi:hypothetical protein
VNNSIVKDKDINASNYACFKSCDIINSGKAIRFVFAGGATYNVDLSYFLLWFEKPHYFIKENPIDISNGMIAVINTDLILSKSAVKICLNNNAVYETPWDTVLMACEERYEHFGGLTEKSKEITNKYHKVHP